MLLGEKKKKKKCEGVWFWHRDSKDVSKRNNLNIYLVVFRVFNNSNVFL